MQKLFTILYGSSLYGTNTPTSDRDVKHIVLPDVNDLLLGRKLEAKVKKTNKEKNVRNSADDVDEEFIPLQIFARHFVEGQTYAIELAFAIDGTHAEQQVFDSRGIVRRRCVGISEMDGPMYSWQVTVNNDGLAGGFEEPTLFSMFVYELRAQFLTSNIKAMMGYVVNQASLYSFKGERLNVTRDLLDIFENSACNPSSMDKTTINQAYEGLGRLLEKTEALAEKYPKYFRKDEYDIGGGVMKPCFVILEKTLPFTNSIAQTLKVLHALKAKYGSRSDAASESNVDWKATMHALRIVDEGLKILSEHELSFPFEPDYVARLLSIKRGELPLDPIKEELASKLDLLKEMEKFTDLPTCDAEFLKKFDVWMVGWLRKFYNL